MIRKASLRGRFNRDMKEEKEFAFQGKKLPERRKSRCPHLKARCTRLPDRGAEHRTERPCLQAAGPEEADGSLLVFHVKEAEDSELRGGDGESSPWPLLFFIPPTTPFIKFPLNAFIHESTYSGLQKSIPTWQPIIGFILPVPISHIGQEPPHLAQCLALMFVE